jgi:LysM repeat protein
MQRPILVVLVLLFLSNLNAQDCVRWHQVVKGETLYGISKTNGCTVDQLLSANPGIVLPLREGVSVCIPKLTATQGAEVKIEETKHHNVVAGETWYGIAQRYKCTVDALMELNPGVQGGLKEGLRLRLPEPIHEASMEAPKPSIKKTGKGSTGKFNLGLFAPFDKEKPEYFEAAVSFMEGVQLAMAEWEDSLPQGIAMHVFNEFEPGTPSMSTAPTAVIGPFLSQNYSRISEQFTRKNIPVFSPFSKQWEPKSEFEFKVNQTDIEAWTWHIINHHKSNPTHSIVVAKSGGGKDSVLRSKVIMGLKAGGVPFSVCEPTGASIAAQTSGGREALVVLMVSNELRIRNLLTGLTRSSVSGRNLHLLVSDDWLAFQVMEVGYYQKFNVQIVAPSHFIEYPLDQTGWPEKYKAIFHAWPDSYSEMGYHLASFLFQKYAGAGDSDWMLSLQEKSLDGVPQRFDFSRNAQGGKAGINRQVRIIGFEDGRLVYLPSGY